MKGKRTQVGLLQMLAEASSKLDPTQKAKAKQAMEKVIHALSVKDQKAADRAVSTLARLFLRTTEMLDEVDE